MAEKRGEESEVRSYEDGPPDGLNEVERLRDAYEEARANLVRIRAKDPSSRSEKELHNAQFTAQVAWLQLKWGDGDNAPACPYCGNQLWEVEQSIPLSVADKGRPLPVFPVACSNCAHVALVSTRLAGLVDEDDQQDTADESVGAEE